MLVDNFLRTIDVNPTLKRLSLKNFYSFKSLKPVPFSGLNLLIGENNSGKSNLIKALRLLQKIHLTDGTDGLKPQCETPEDFINAKYDKAPEGARIKAVFELEFKYSISGGWCSLENNRPLLECAELSFLKDGPLNKECTLPIRIELTEAASYIDLNKGFRAFRKNFGPKNKTPDYIYFKRFFAKLADHLITGLPKQVFIVEDARLIAPVNGNWGGTSKWLYNVYLNKKNPNSNDYNRILALKSFIKPFLSLEATEQIELTGDENDSVITITTPSYCRRDIVNLGAGIREIVILAVKASHFNNSIIAIEEPESHLHPKLLNSFFRFIEHNSEKYFNQYFISSHSNIGVARWLNGTFSDYSVFSLKNTESSFSVMEKIECKFAAFGIISELGYKPTDLFFANCVIWVEGPSDAVYIEKWLELFVYHNGKRYIPKRDVDYTFAFYGGATFKYYSIDEDNGRNKGFSRLESGMVSLSNINRNMIIVMDSDLNKPPMRDTKYRIGRLSRETKIRIIDECTNFKIPYWLTFGREIENYISESTIRKCWGGVKEYRLFDKLGSTKKANKLGVVNPYRVPGSSGYIKDNNKVDGARKLAGKMKWRSEFEDNGEASRDLALNIGAVYRYIAKYNHIELGT